jgi:hypothetical protein
MINDVVSGSSFPLGAAAAGHGVKFSVYSKSAAKVDLRFSTPQPRTEHGGFFPGDFVSKYLPVRQAGS